MAAPPLLVPSCSRRLSLVCAFGHWTVGVTVTSQSRLWVSLALPVCTGNSRVLGRPSSSQAPSWGHPLHFLLTPQAPHPALSSLSPQPLSAAPPDLGKVRRASAPPRIPAPGAPCRETNCIQIVSCYAPPHTHTFPKHLLVRPLPTTSSPPTWRLKAGRAGRDPVVYDACAGGPAALGLLCQAPVPLGPSLVWRKDLTPTLIRESDPGPVPLCVN